MSIGIFPAYMSVRIELTWSYGQKLGAVWELGVEPVSTGRAICSLNC